MKRIVLFCILLLLTSVSINAAILLGYFMRQELEKMRPVNISGLESPGDYEYSGLTDSGKSYRFKIYVETARVVAENKVKPFIGIVNEKNDTLVHAINWRWQTSSNISDICYYRWGDGFYHIICNDGGEYIMSNDGICSYSYADVVPQYTDGNIWFKYRNGGEMGAFMEVSLVDKSGRCAEVEYSTIIYPSIYTLDIKYEDDRFSVKSVDGVWYQTHYTLATKSVPIHPLRVEQHSAFLYQSGNCRCEIPNYKSVFSELIGPDFRRSYCYQGLCWDLWGTHPQNDPVAVEVSFYLPILKQLCKEDDNYAFMYACFLSGNIDATAPIADGVEGLLDCEWIKVNTHQEYRQYMDEQKAKQIFFDYFSKDVIKSCFDLTPYIDKETMKSLVLKRYPELSLPDVEQTFVLTDTVNCDDAQPIQGTYYMYVLKNEEKFMPYMFQKPLPTIVGVAIHSTFITVGTKQYDIKKANSLHGKMVYSVEDDEGRALDLIVEDYAAGAKLLIITGVKEQYILTEQKRDDDTAPKFGLG